MDFSPRIERLLPLVRQASQIAMQHYGNINGRLKDDGSLVTKADKEVELFIKDGLNKRFPGENIIGEETGVSNHNFDLAWSVDPIDGTAAYIARMPHWGVSIGLICEGQPVLGVIFMPVLGETYWACRGNGAFMQTELWGRQRLQVCQDKEIQKNSNLLVPSRFMRHYSFDYRGKLRSLGSTVAHVLLVARGDAIGCITNGYQWDMAGCLPILWEAGGLSYTMEGPPVDVTRLLPEYGEMPTIVSTTPQLEEAIRRCNLKANR